MGSKHVRFFLILVCSTVFVMCKGPEKTSSPTVSKCMGLIEKPSQDSLYFVGQVESTNRKVAVKRAEKESLIDLVQFFQSNFIEGGQLDLFSGTEHKTRSAMDQNEQFRKAWAEKSYQLIGQDHNHSAFAHKHQVLKDSSGVFRAHNVLVISEDWIRAHWKRSLTATDENFYREAQKREYYSKLMQMDIRQENPCRKF